MIIFFSPRFRSEVHIIGLICVTI